MTYLCFFSEVLVLLLWCPSPKFSILITRRLLYRRGHELTEAGIYMYYVYKSIDMHLVSFEADLQYKRGVGSSVRIKSIIWFNCNKQPLHFFQWSVIIVRVVYPSHWLVRNCFSYELWHIQSIHWAENVLLQVDCMCSCSMEPTFDQFNPFK